MYIFGLVLFAISFGLIGFGVFTTLVRSEKKKGRIALVVGTLLLITTFVMYTYMPSTSGEDRITVESVAVTEDENGAYRCSVTEQDYDGLTYHYEAASEEDAEAFCDQFQTGEKYLISFEYDLDTEEYSLVEVKGQE
jgi:predicted hotdog family 3-hydroxylacyl-ACP dehydratase